MRYRREREKKIRAVRRLVTILIGCGLLLSLVFNFTQGSGALETMVNRLTAGLADAGNRSGVQPDGEWEEPLPNDSRGDNLSPESPPEAESQAAEQLLKDKSESEDAADDADPDDVLTGEAAPDSLWKETFRPVPASPPVNQGYFEDALFIGDSRVMGLMLYSGLTEATFYTEKGVNVSTLLTNKIVTLTGGGKITIPEALKKQSFGKIYIKMGLNELGWKNTGLFIDAYGEVIEKIRELQPDAIFYVQSIMPVTREKSASKDVYTNERIVEFNELIKKMTWEKGVHYLDLYTRMAGIEGCLPEDASTDGVHLNKKYSVLWLEFLKRHTVREEEFPSSINAGGVE